MACVFNFNALNEVTGKEVTDPLWTALKDYYKGNSDSHVLSKIYYGIATDPSFQAEAGQLLSYIPGFPTLPTLESLLKVLKESPNKEGLIRSIEKSLGNPIVDYDSAIYKIQAFNNNQDSQFMLNFEETDSGKVRLIVQDKNNSNTADLYKKITNRSLVDRMLWYLRQAGADVSFLEGYTESIFDPNHAEKNAAALYEIIKLAKNGTTIQADFAELCGQFAVRALGASNPFVSRLIDAIEANNNLLKNEYFKEHGYDEATKQKYENSMSFAGHLIGMALQEGVDIADESKVLSTFNKISNKLGRLLTRLFFNFINLFRKVNIGEYTRAMWEAKDNASSIAKGFMSTKFSGTVENALRDSEGFSTENNSKLLHTSLEVRKAKEILNILDSMVKDMATIDKKIYKQLQKDLADVEGRLDINQPDTVFMQERALTTIVHAIKFLVDNNYNIEKIYKVNFNDEVDFISNMSKNADGILAATVYANTAANVVDILDKLASESLSNSSEAVLGNVEITMTSPYGTQSIVKLKDALQPLKELVLGEGTRPGLITSIRNAKESYTLRFMQEIIGSKQIHFAARRLGIFKQERVAAQDVTVQQLIDFLAEDINWWESYFASMSNNSDIIGQAFDKILKVTKQQANAKTIEERNDLLLLKREAEAKKVNFSHLYDRDEDGIATCYLKGYVEIEGEKVGVDWGKWSEDFENFIKTSKEAFQQKYGRKKLNSLRDAQKALLWGKFIHKEYVEWHKENSISVVKANGKREYQPSPKKYRSQAYDNLTDNQKIILDKYLDIKKKLDKKLGDNQTQLFRAPQMYSSTLNQIDNRLIAGENLLSATAHSLMQRLCDAVTVTPEELDFGSDTTINNTDPLHDYREYQDDKVKRIPLFYINKIKKEKRLKMSTDLIGTTIAYAAMANQYKYLSDVKSSIEVSREQMKNRKIGKWSSGDFDNFRDDGRSKAYKRILGFVDKELYGMTFDIRRSNLNTLMAKLVQLSSNLASRMFLGGNIQGGTANTLMGASEVLKEAVAGQFFGLNAYGKATKTYFTACFEGGESMIIDAFRQVKKNKVNAFADKFDIFGDNSRIFRSYDFKNEKVTSAMVADIFINNCFMPYSTGDHYMQILPFLALAYDTPLYYIDDSGKTIETNVYDIYEIDRGEGVATNMLKVDTKKQYIKKLSSVQEVKEKNQEVADLQNFISDLKQHIETLNGIGISVWDDSKYSKLQKKYNITINNDAASLDNKNSLKLLEDTLSKVKQNIADLTWTINDENAFKMKGREIANRMHGIYNNQDKVGIQRNIIGNMVLAMRGYALGMVERRWDSNKYSLLLGTDMEGSGLTALRAFVGGFNPWENEITLKKMMLMWFSPVTNPQYVQEIMDNLGFSESQFYNMRRNFADWCVILLSSIMCGGIFRLFGFHGLLGRPSDSDDDDYYPKNHEDMLPAYLYYFMCRLNLESSAYNLPSVFLSSEAPSVLTLFSSNMAFLSNMLKILEYAITGEEYVQGPHEGEKKAYVKLMKYFPVLRVKYSINENPRKAAESFEYGRGRYGR